MKKIIEHIKQLSFYETIRHGSVYLFAYIAVQALTVLSLPIYTKLLVPSDFGIYEVFNNTVRILGIVFSLNLFNGFYRYYFEENIDKKSLLQYLLRTSLLSFLVGVVLLLLFRQKLLTLLNLPSHLFYWIFIAVFANIIFNFFNTFNTAQKLSTRAGLWQLFTHLFRIIAAVSMIIFVSKNYYGRIVGENLILFLLSFVIIIIYFRNHIGFKENLLNKKDIIRYSVSFIPISLSGFVLGYLDTIMINSYEGSNDAGLYSYAYKIAIIYSGVTTAFITANRPKLFELLNIGKEEEVIEQIRSMFKLVVALSAFFIFFSIDAGKFLALNKAFYAGLHLMPVLILSYIFNDLNELYSFYFHYEKKVKYFYYSFAVSAVINIVLNVLLIPKYGYSVAAYTTLISYAFMLLCTYIICKVIVKVKVPSVNRFLDFILIIALVLGLNYLCTTQIENWFFQAAVKSTIYILVLAYLWKNMIKQLVFSPK